MSHSFTDAELSTNVLISKVSLPTVGKFNCSRVLLVIQDLWWLQESKMTWVYFPVSWLSGLEIKAWAVCNSTELLLLPTCIVDVPTSLDLSWEVSDLLSEADPVPELSTGLDRLLRIFTDGHVMSSSTIKTLGLWLTTWCNMPCFQAKKTPTTSSQYSSSSLWFSNGTTGDRLDFSCKRHNAEYNLHCLHKVRMRKGAVWIFPYAGQILG